MGIWFIMLGIDVLIPAVMLIAGRLMEKHVPKRINRTFGYRTAMSMKNKDTWTVAHKVSGAFWWKWGWVTLAVTLGGMLLLLGQSAELISTVGCILMFLQLIPVIAVIPYTEKALSNTFDRDGNRRTDPSCNM